VWVGYPIYYNSLTADKSGPQLSPELFKKNNIHIIFLKLDKKPAPSSVTPPGSPSYVTLDVNCGAIIATPAVEAKIRRLALKP
jgi:hypothetical protein